MNEPDVKGSTGKAARTDLRNKIEHRRVLAADYAYRVLVVPFYLSPFTTNTFGNSCRLDAP
jgi:hypothetical protein